MGLGHLELIRLYWESAVNLCAGSQGSGIKKKPIPNWNGLFTLCSLLYALFC